MSSVSGVGAPQTTTPPASQNPVTQDAAAQANKDSNAGAASAPANSSKPDNASNTDAVPPSKPAGQGQVVYISA